MLSILAFKRAPRLVVPAAAASSAAFASGLVFAGFAFGLAAFSSDDTESLALLRSEKRRYDNILRDLRFILT